MFNFDDNKVKIAVHRVGGPTKTSNELHVSNATIHNWVTGVRQLIA